MTTEHTYPIWYKGKGYYSRGYVFICGIEDKRTLAAFKNMGFYTRYIDMEKYFEDMDKAIGHFANKRKDK